MKLFLHERAVGAATVNAIELAGSLRDRHGHDVVAFASPGPMLGVARESGLRVLLAPQAYRYPDRVIVWRLAHAMKGEGLTRAVDAMDKLGADPRLRLPIVGEGPARRDLQRRADSAVDASAWKNCLV